MEMRAISYNKAFGTKEYVQERKEEGRGEKKDRKGRKSTIEWGMDEAKWRG